MLVPVSTGVWYGPAAAAGILPAGGLTSAAISGRARPGGTLGGSAAVPVADATRLVNRPATLPGLGQVTGALPRARVRAAVSIRVNALSQDDVTGAVLEAEVEPGLSVKEALRIALAVLAGKASGAPGSVITFRDATDSKPRVVATVDDNGNRTAIVLDGSDV